MLTRPRRALFAALLALAAIAPSQPARADGDEAFSVLLHETAPGLGITSIGAGYAGRRPSRNSVPVSEQHLVVEGLPAGATVVHAYLYWIVYGMVGDDTLTFGRSEPYATVTGTLIGTSADACWDGFYSDEIAHNRSYRADVTSLVTGNGSYRVTDLVSAGDTSDTQGISLVVIYQDPADPALGTVVLQDGAITVLDNGEHIGAFTDLSITGPVLEASIRFGAGDGQSINPDDDVEVLGDELPRPGFDWWRQRNGAYWDDVASDITSRIQPGLETVDFKLEMDIDCVAFVYTALAFRQEAAPASEDAGVGEDAGAPPDDAGTSEDAGASEDAGIALDGGSTTLDAGSSLDAGEPALAESDGCSCRVGARSRPSAALLLCALALGTLFVRRRKS